MLCRNILSNEFSLKQTSLLIFVQIHAKVMDNLVVNGYDDLQFQLVKQTQELHMEHGFSQVCAQHKVTREKP